MEVAGLSLAVLAELRTLAVGLEERWKSYKNRPKRFAAVEKTVTALLTYLNKIAGIACANPDALPIEASSIFKAKLAEVRDGLARLSDMIFKYCSTAFKDGA